MAPKRYGRQVSQMCLVSAKADQNASFVKRLVAATCDLWTARPLSVASGHARVEVGYQTYGPESAPKRADDFRAAHLASEFPH